MSRIQVSNDGGDCDSHGNQNKNIRAIKKKITENTTTRLGTYRHAADSDFRPSLK